MQDRVVRLNAVVASAMVRRLAQWASEGVACDLCTSA
jgi:hypothetical protein